MKRILARPGSRREGYGFPADTRLLRRRWYALALEHLDTASLEVVRNAACFGDLSTDLVRYPPETWQTMLHGLLDEDDELVPELFAFLEAGRPQAAADLLEQQVGRGAPLD